MLVRMPRLSGSRQSGDQRDKHAIEASLRRRLVSREEGAQLRRERGPHSDVECCVARVMFFEPVLS